MLQSFNPSLKDRFCFTHMSHGFDLSLIENTMFQVKEEKQLVTSCQQASFQWENFANLEIAQRFCSPHVYSMS